MFDVITIGSATRDVFFKAEDFEVRKHADSPTGVELCFPLGSKIEIKEVVFATGGGGTNTAVTFARQGLKTACVGVVADDFNGHEILDELKREGIEPIFHIFDEGHTAYSVIIALPDASRTILSYKGEGQNFDISKIDFDKLESKWIYIDSLGGHLELLEAIVNHARKNNIKLAFNPGGKILALGLEKLKPFLKYINVYTTNQEEASLLSGIDYKKEEEIFKFMDEIIDGVFVMTKGPEGVVVSDGKNIYSAGTPDSPRVERTGAGDAFGSGFVAGYIQKNGDIEFAIQLATANASSVVTKFGSKAGILKRGDMGPWELVKVEVKPLK